MAQITDTPYTGLLYQDFIARLVAEREARTYLEIGVQNGINLSKISVPSAFGVDPGFALTVDPTAGKESLRLYRMTSDRFFRDHAAEVRSAGPLDFAFLDGMHLFEYLLRDVYNTERLCGRAGLITIHDCLPFDGEMIERQNNTPGRTPGPWAAAWTGDVWKILPILQKYRPDLKVILVDCAPTGLVCVTNLDPSSTVLEDRYLDIVAEYHAMPNDRAALAAFFDTQQIVSADALLANFGHSLPFRI